MEKAIKIAIENGWKPLNWLDNPIYVEEKKWGIETEAWKVFAIYNADGNKTLVEVFTTVCDPLFWQALGKGLGWYKYTEIEFDLPEDRATRIKKLNHLEEKVGVCLRYKDNKTKMVVSPYKKQGTYSWKEHWHRFIDHLAEGKDINSFFEELTK